MTDQQIIEEMYTALKVAKLVIKELIYNEPNSYSPQLALIQNAIDIVDMK